MACDGDTREALMCVVREAIQSDQLSQSDAQLCQSLLSKESDVHIEQLDWGAGRLYRAEFGSAGCLLLQTFCTTQQAQKAFTNAETLVNMGHNWIVRPIFVSSKQPIVLSEAEKDYSSLRRQISQSMGRVDKVALQLLGARLGSLHCATHTAAMSEPQKQEIVDKFSHPDLIEQTSSHVFDAINKTDFGALDDKVKNRLNKLKADQGFSQKVVDLRQIFDTRVECVIHGDFNADAILAHVGKIKVTTLDGVCFGPCAYDLGVIFAEYLIFYNTHMVTPQNNDEHRQVSYVMMDACSRTAEAYFDQMTVAVNDREQYKQTIISEAAGYAGVYMLKRCLFTPGQLPLAQLAYGFYGYSILGPDPHPDLVGDGGRQSEVLEAAVRLINSYPRILNAGRVAFIGLMLC